MKTLDIELPAEVADKLDGEAFAAGVEPEAYLEIWLRGFLAGQTRKRSHEPHLGDVEAE